MEPLNPGRIDELGFVVKKDIQLVVADPAQVQKAIEKFYPEDNESINDILNELGSDKELAKEVSELAVTDDAITVAVELGWVLEKTVRGTLEETLKRKIDPVLKA